MSELFEKPQYPTTFPDFERYALEYTTPEPELMQQLIRDTHLAVTTPGMLSGLLQGRLLKMISQMIRPKAILEIGTFTGYSAIYLAAGLAEDGKLHTIDNNPEVAHIAEKYFKASGLQDKIVAHQGDALEVIGELEALSISFSSMPTRKTTSATTKRSYPSSPPAALSLPTMCCGMARCFRKMPSPIRRHAELPPSTSM